jgi:hypothetical protein
VIGSVKIALAAGLVLTTIAVGAVLTRSPLLVAGTNSISVRKAVRDLHGDDGGCQQVSTLPAGTSAIRLSLAAGIGPRVRLTAFAGRGVLTRGERAAGWVDGTVTVPVRGVPHMVRNALICTTVGPAIERLEIGGTPVKPSPRGRNFDGLELRMEYLRPGTQSWLTLAPSISRRLGLGHAAAGTWIVFLLLALMLAVAALAARLMSRELP